MTYPPVPPSAAPYEYAAWRRATLSRGLIAVTLLVGEVAWTLLAAVAWLALAEGLTFGEEVASISVLGGCAIAGLPVTAIIAIANFQARRARHAGHTLAPARRLATTAQWLAVIRLLGLLTASALLAIATSIDIDQIDVSFHVMALIDAICAILIAIRTGSAVNRPPASP